MHELFQIKSRFSGAVLFEGRFGSLRLCVEAAVSARANLAGADLAGCDLAGADLARSYLARANLARCDLARADLAGSYLARADLAGSYLDGGLKVLSLPRRATRSDGYEFLLWQTDAGYRVKAGCRFFDMDAARVHWTAKRGGTPLGNESADILDFFQRHIDREMDHHMSHHQQIDSQPSQQKEDV